MREGRMNTNIKTPWATCVLALVMLVLTGLTTVHAQEMESSTTQTVKDYLTGEGNGFVSLFDGKSTYEGREDEKNAIGSFFLVRIWDDYNFFLGAMTIASFDTISHSFDDLRSSGDTAEVEISSSFQHRAYGTMVGYVYNSKDLLALQVWGGGGYISNLIDIESDIRELVTDSAGNSYQCSGSTAGESIEVKSYPFFLGIGITFWEFGFFAQMITQTVDDIEVNHSGTISCNRGASSDTHAIESIEDVAVSFSSTQIGIQYWF